MAAPKCYYYPLTLSRLSYASAQVDTNRAKINMIHDNNALKVSQDEANRVEEEAKRRLIATKKLSLVVDLDQTIIQATVDPTVHEWQKDPDNANFEAVKDVRSFQLVDDGPGGRGTWYYIKLRPGLKDFLDTVSSIYELHIYTMGTRAYAQHIAQIVDPDRKYFGDRILSRDESGSMFVKSLQRLFPVDTRMVVIIDDRGDVWNWSPNLIKVTPFNFFVGIGDINSSFLPKKPKSRLTAQAESPKPEAKAKENGTLHEEEPSKTNGDRSSQGPPIVGKPAGTPAPTPDQDILMRDGNESGLLEEQAAKQDKVLTEQLQERPLLQAQKQLDAEEYSDSEAQKPRHHLLIDNDRELAALGNVLRQVHGEFFEVYSRKLADVQGGRLSQLRGARSSGKRPSPNLDLEVVPDIKTVMPELKQRVLEGVNLVFSGVIPLDVDTQTADVTIWARQFGAKVQARVSGKMTTHVVAARNRTAKVRQAVKRGKGRIKVVSPDWLTDCIQHWTRFPEIDYLLKTDDDAIGKPLPGEEHDEILSESEEVASAPDTDAESETVPPTNGAGEKKLGTPRLNLRLRSRSPRATPTPGENGLDSDEDMDGLIPDELDDPISPIGTPEDWKRMQEELGDLSSTDSGDDEDDDDGYDDDDDNDAENFGDSSSGRDRNDNKNDREHAFEKEPDSDEDSDANKAGKRIARSRSGSPSLRGGSGQGGRRAKRTFGEISADGSDEGAEGVSPTSRKKVAVEHAPSPSTAETTGLPTPAVTAEAEGGDDDDDGWSQFDGDLEAEIEKAARAEEEANHAAATAAAEGDGSA